MIEHGSTRSITTSFWEPPTTGQKNVWKVQRPSGASPPPSRGLTLVRITRDCVITCALKPRVGRLKRSISSAADVVARARSHIATTRAPNARVKVGYDEKE